MNFNLYTVKPTTKKGIKFSKGNDQWRPSIQFTFKWKRQVYWFLLFL